jgi:predicted PurR-regulated permease PerM
MKVKIEIDTITFVRFWLVVIGFAAAILAVYSARTALVILAIAVFLALALNGPVSYITNRLPGRSRVGATALAYIFVVLFLGTFLFLVVPPITQQTAKFIQTLPTIADNVTTQWQGLSTVIDKYHLQPQVDSALENIKQTSSSWAGNIGNNAISSIGSVLFIASSALLILVLSFLMLVEGPMWLDRLWHLYTDEEKMKHHRSLAHKMYNVVTGYVVGQLTVSAIGATFAGIAVFIITFFFTEAPHNLALPAVAIAFTLSLIPLFGAMISGTIISLLLGFNDISAGVVFAVFFIIYQQIENNFIAPTIQASKVELSALAVLVSIVIGIYVFGIAGGIISIPIAGSIKVLLDDYLKHTRKERIKSEPPITKLIKKLQGQQDDTAV